MGNTIGAIQVYDLVASGEHTGEGAVRDALPSEILAQLNLAPDVNILTDAEYADLMFASVAQEFSGFKVARNDQNGNTEFWVRNSHAGVQAQARLIAHNGGQALAMSQLGAGFVGVGAFQAGFSVINNSGAGNLSLLTGGGNIDFYPTNDSSPTGLRLSVKNAGIEVIGTVKLTGYTVATLPTPTIGMCAYVTDALAPTFGANVVGGGAVKIKVFYDGVSWIVG